MFSWIAHHYEDGISRIIIILNFIQRIELTATFFFIFCCCCAHLQGNTMYAEIPAKEADKLGPMIQVDRTYVIARFKVCNAKKIFKSVPGPYMLEFTCHTKISAATEQITGPKYIYNLTPFEKLPEFINDTKKFHG